MNSLLTLIQTIDPVVVAKTYSLIDGEVDKKSVASITRGVARSHAVPDAEEMMRVLAEVTARDDTAIVTGHFDGLPDGENVDVVTRKELARLLGVDETDDERLAGLHDFNGKLHAARLNVSIAPGFWALLDFDNPPGMPEEWAVLGIAERLAMMERVLPGVSTCERIELRSSSSRVVRPGGLPGPASHAWVRLSDARKVVVLRGYLRVQTVLEGLSFVSPHYDRKTGEELPRIDHRTLFDLAVFSPERLVFCAKPQISAEMVEAGYTVADADIRLVNAGNGSLDVSKIELPPASSLRTYKAETGEELKLSINRSGLRTESHGVLQWDTPITSKGKTKTLKEWVEDMPTSGKIRCEAPFRASQSEAAFIRLGSDGKPYVYDSCGGIKYVLPMFPGSSEREAAPVDLWANHGAPELPQGLLPVPIDTFARSHSAMMGVDPAGLAMACLAVCAAAITDEIQLQVKQHDSAWRESARLWVGLVGSPSMKKTPIISAAARPLKRIDGNLMQRYVEKRQAYDELTPKERKGVDRPRQERRIISDATVEAAQEVLKDSPRGVLSLQDELSGWFGQMDKYAPGKGAQADRGFWLQAYNGGSYSLNRIGRGASYIPNCSIGLLGGIQPEPIRAIAGDTHDDGLVQRLIPVVLRPGKIGRDAPDDGTLAAYERLIERLELLRAGDAPLRFDEAARAIRERLEAEHLNLAQSLETVSPKMAAHFGKHDGLFARLCVLWHCIEHNHGGRVPETISGNTADRVAQFMVRFIRPSAVAFYAGLLGMSAGHDRLLDLAAWILAANVDEVKSRDVQASGQAFRHVTADEVRLLCEKLEAFGWGNWADPAIKSNKPRFLVNPRVHSLFAERGRAEAERRAKARELIRQTIGG